jgi:hypothetical protein
MTSSSTALLPLPEATPHEVRAALRQEFRAQFDQDYRPRWTRAAGH